MKKLLEFIIQSIVASPDQVEVVEEKTEEGTKLTIIAPQEEIGSIIGQKGRIIKAIKTILAIKAKGQRFFLKAREK